MAFQIRLYGVHALLVAMIADMAVGKTELEIKKIYEGHAMAWYKLLKLVSRST